MKTTPKQPKRRRQARPAAESNGKERVIYVPPCCISEKLTPEKARELAEAFRKAYPQFADKP